MLFTIFTCNNVPLWVVSEWERKRKREKERKCVNKREKSVRVSGKNGKCGVKQGKEKSCLSWHVIRSFSLTLLLFLLLFLFPTSPSFSCTQSCNAWCNAMLQQWCDCEWYYREEWMHHEMDATATRAFCCSLMRIKGPTECNARVSSEKGTFLVKKKTWVAQT